MERNRQKANDNDLRALPRTAGAVESKRLWEAKGESGGLLVQDV